MKTTIRHLEINNRPILGRIFVRHQCYRNRRIAGYVTIATVMMTDKKTSKGGWLFVSSCLSKLFPSSLSNSSIVLNQHYSVKVPHLAQGLNIIITLSLLASLITLSCLKP